jgi:hypothetical protein
VIKAAVVPAALATTIACAPVAQADPCNNQACLQRPFSQAGGPYIGDWGAHKEHVVVNADGSGTETSSYGTVNFRMTFVSTSDPTASGNVTGGAKQVGSYVNMQLVDSGNGMLFSVGGGDQNFPFCKMVGGSYANSADCGA